MEILETIGVDVSKKTIDVFLYKQGQHLEFDNNEKGFKKMERWVIKNSPSPQENLFFAMEHTGLYSYQLSQYLAKRNLSYKLIPGLEIKRSMGIVRGKDDKVDSKRIALYAYEKRERLEPDTPRTKEMEDLKRLLSLRERLVKQCAGYKASVKELRAILSKKESKTAIKVQENMIKYLSKEVNRVEKEIEIIIKEDPAMRRQHHLLTSIIGIGDQTAYCMIVLTDGFTKFDKWRKFASYAGTAPFPNSSGTSIRGRTRVSKLANKRMKSLLELCARSAVQYNPELKEYYDKRVKKGKEKSKILNIIRNKLIARAFAVIQRDTPYVDLMKYAA